MPAPNPFANLPAISFANTDVTALANAFITGWEAAWLADTGEVVNLSPADRRYHFILSFMGFIISANEQLDAAMKQDLLPFATGGFLDNITTIFGERAKRLGAQGAQTLLQFTLPSFTDQISDIPEGTQVSDGSGTGLIFATDNDLQIQPENLIGSVYATCTTVGPIGNGIPAGSVNGLIGWTNTSFTPTVTNLDTTSDGSDAESDDAMRARVFGVTDSYSNAGSYGAYRFFSESADPTISEVAISGPEDGLAPGNVLVTVLCDGGNLPSTSILNKVRASINDDTVRDLCARVTVSAPTGVPFSVDISYWVPKVSVNNLSNIQTSVENAVQGFITNATTTLAYDVDPSILSASIVNAGAVNVIVNSPSFTTLVKSQVPILVGDPVITYLGLQ
jgi:phage-related baseplate assembly protein